MSCTALLIIGLAVTQVTETLTGRFGSVARSLTGPELAQIHDLANRAGKAPWLTLGFPSMITGVASVSVFLQPDATDQRLHRGRMLILVADDAPVVQVRGPWRVKGTFGYAYVVPSSGRLREIADEQDINWPFALEGEIADETLLSVVSFVRSRPAITSVAKGQAPREVVEAPISAVARRGDQFIVGLQTGEATGHQVTLIRKDGRWMITSYQMWIV